MEKVASEASPLVDGSSRRTTTWPLFVTVMPAILGYVVEFYDYGIYTCLTNEIELAMFGSDTSLEASTFVWRAFALGQACRPLGGVIIGWFADRYGRRNAIIAATIGMGIGTIGLGCVPTQRCCGNGWGVVGIVLVFFFRALQGLSAAGEVAVVFTYAVECAPRHQTGLTIGIAAMAGTLGWVLGALISWLMETALGENSDALLDWGWRLPFLLSLPLSGAILWMQLGLSESGEFEKLVEQTGQQAAGLPLTASEAPTASAAGAPKEELAKRAAKMKPKTTQPIFKDLWAHHKRVMAICTLLVGAPTALHYGTVVYAKDFLVASGVRTVSIAAQTNALMTALTLVANLASGMLADRIGFLPLNVIVVALCVVLVYPSWCLLVAPSANAGFLGAALFAMLYGSSFVGLLGVSIGLFPVEYRATGFGLTYNSAMLVFAAPAPLVSNALYEHISAGVPDPQNLVINTVPAIVTSFGIVASVASLLWLYVSLRSGALTTASHVRDEHF